MHGLSLAMGETTRGRLVSVGEVFCFTKQNFCFGNTQEDLGIVSSETFRRVQTRMLSTILRPVRSKSISLPVAQSNPCYANANILVILLRQILHRGTLEIQTSSSRPATQSHLSRQ